jgi:peptidyl-dipeptidase Dcp
MNLNDIEIRTDIKPGDLGYVMYRHGKLYSEEYNYGVSFETYVGAGLHEFYKNYDSQRTGYGYVSIMNQIVGFFY